MAARGVGSTDLGPRPAHPHLAGGGGGGARAEVGVVVGRHGAAATTEGAAHSEPEEDEDYFEEVKKMLSRHPEAQDPVAVPPMVVHSVLV